MKMLSKRLFRLESELAVRNRRDPKKTLRLVVRHLGRKLDNASCKRTLTASGFLTEVVHLDGMRNSLSDADLERFIERQPPGPYQIRCKIPCK
jgi:hypothetical protein